MPCPQRPHCQVETSRQWAAIPLTLPSGLARPAGLDTHPPVLPGLWGKTQMSLCTRDARIRPHQTSFDIERLFASCAPFPPLRLREPAVLSPTELFQLPLPGLPHTGLFFSAFQDERQRGNPLCRPYMGRSSLSLIPFIISNGVRFKVRPNCPLYLPREHCLLSRQHNPAGATAPHAALPTCQLPEPGCNYSAHANGLERPKLGVQNTGRRKGCAVPASPSRTAPEDTASPRPLSSSSAFLAL